MMPAERVEPRDDSAENVPLNFYATCITHKANEAPIIAMEETRTQLLIKVPTGKKVKSGSENDVLANNGLFRFSQGDMKKYVKLRHLKFFRKTISTDQ